MKRVSLSGSNKTIQEVWDWYTFQFAISNETKNQIRRQGLNAVPGTMVHGKSFFGMSFDEIDEFFEELDHVAILDLMTSAEAALRVNFLERAYRDRGRGEVISKAFRKIYKNRKSQGGSVRLEEDILETWKAHHPEVKSAVSDFKGALKLRHWLAHGRYWTPKFGTDYSPDDIFDIANELIKKIG